MTAYIKKPNHTESEQINISERNINKTRDCLVKFLSIFYSVSVTTLPSSNFQKDAILRWEIG